ncbi:TPA: hypothetical protein CPT82_05190 [Candidatus Gastranaerophilales bacterium HUM_2]|nr:MAG TPA: hypothetical protein CPT82_05190 [Candidatus Gastranaerophilales bacterium HUM_2]
MYSVKTGSLYFCHQSRFKYSILLSTSFLFVFACAVEIVHSNSNRAKSILKFFMLAISFSCVIIITQRKIMDKTDLLKSRIGMKLVRVGKMVRAIANQKFVKANYEITPEQFTVLTAILDHDGLYQRQIGAITLKDRPNITRIINILENKELVTRTPDTNKRKVFKINITEKGKKEYETVLPTVIEHWQDSVSGVSDEELTNCLNVLNKIKANLEEKLHIQI